MSFYIQNGTIPRRELLSLAVNDDKRVRLDFKFTDNVIVWVVKLPA